MAIWRSIAKDHPDLAYAQGNLARVRVAQGNPAQAAHLFQQALAIMAAKLPNHWARTEMQSLYGESLSLQGQHQAGERELGLGLEALVRKRGEDDEHTKDARQRLADNYIRSAGQSQ